MKKYKWLIILGAIILGLILIIAIFSENESKYIKDVSMNKIIEKIENEDSFILYIKQTTCDHCKTFTPKLVSALKETGLKAYSLNLTNFTEKDQELYNKTFKVNATPTVLFIIDGNESIINIKGSQNKDKVISVFKQAGFVK